MKKLILAIVAGVAVFLVTPYFVWQAFEEHYDFGAVDMAKAVEGTWQVELHPRTGEARTLTLTIAQANAPKRVGGDGGWIRSAAACGHRTLIKSAEACITITSMPLEVTAAETELTGQLDVEGESFVNARLRVAFPAEQLKFDWGQDPRTITATLSPTGEVSDAWTNDGTVTLRRIDAKLK